MLVCVKNMSKFVVRFYEMRNTTNMFNYKINKKIHFYKYDNHSSPTFSVNSVTIIRVSYYNNNTINIQ